MDTLRIFDLVPGKKYKTVGFNNSLGKLTYSVKAPVIEKENIYALYEIQVDEETLKAATRYTLFVEAPFISPFHTVKE
jgi:hypothetical protein